MLQRRRDAPVQAPMSKTTPPCAASFLTSLTKRQSPHRLTAARRSPTAPAARISSCRNARRSPAHDDRRPTLPSPYIPTPHRRRRPVDLCGSAAHGLLLPAAAPALSVIGVTHSADGGAIFIRLPFHVLFSAHGTRQGFVFSLRELQ